jgi:hypothetical protein
MNASSSLIRQQLLIFEIIAIECDPLKTFGVWWQLQGFIKFHDGCIFSGACTCFILINNLLRKEAAAEFDLFIGSNT